MMVDTWAPWIGFRSVARLPKTARAGAHVRTRDGRCWAWSSQVAAWVHTWTLRATEYDEAIPLPPAIRQAIEHRAAVGNGRYAYAETAGRRGHPPA